MVEHGSQIEWTHVPGYRGESYNPVIGCTKVSTGCAHCYAERLALRWGKTFDLVLHPEALEKPLHWREPRAIFVCSMSDLFHADVPDEYIDQVVRMARVTPRHLYLSLTKRAERMERYWYHRQAAPRNWWQGVTVENAANNDRAYHLEASGVQHRFISVEPMVGPDHCLTFDVEDWGHMGIEWVLVGGESGPSPREVPVAAYQRIVDQCREHGIACFVKQDSGRRPGLQGRLPDDVWNVKEFPEAMISKCQA